jgi:hypothetical protein
MPIECMSELRLRKIANFEDLCKAMKVDDNGKPHREVKIFVWDTTLKALLLVDKFYYEEERVGTVAGKLYNAENEDIFVEDFLD